MTGESIEDPGFDQPGIMDETPGSPVLLVDHGKSPHGHRFRGPAGQPGVPHDAPAFGTGLRQPGQRRY